MINGYIYGSYEVNRVISNVTELIQIDSQIIFQAFLRLLNKQLNVEAVSHNTLLSPCYPSSRHSELLVAFNTAGGHG